MMLKMLSRSVNVDFSQYNITAVQVTYSSSPFLQRKLSYLTIITGGNVKERSTPSPSAHCSSS